MGWSRRALLFGALGGALASRRAHARPLYPRFRPLTLRELYGSQVRFLGGEPSISVGVGQRLPEARIRAEQRPLRLMFEERGLPKIVYVDDEVVLRAAGSAGRRRYWVRAPRPLPGVEVRRVERGILVALEGNVLDTRKEHIWLGGSEDRAEAEGLRDRLHREGWGALAIDADLDAPTSPVEVDAGGKTMRADGPVCVSSAEEEPLLWHERGAYAGHFYGVADPDGGLTLVNSVGAERLLAGLVPAEMFASAPLEALKAQAVTARGAIFSKVGQRHFDAPFHLCAEQHCQVYRGRAAEDPRTTRAVEQTRGMLAMSGGQPVLSVYSSTCGGFSEANEVVWDQEPSPSLRARLDGDPTDPALRRFAGGLNESNIRAWLDSEPPTFEARSSFLREDKYRWRVRFAQADLRGLFVDVGEVERLEILGRGPGGRVTGVRVVGAERSRTVLRELPVRRAFGGLNSGMFVVDHERDELGRLRAVELAGGGWGHGVGMCQIGAIGRAEQGQSFEEILAHYYGGAEVQRFY